MTCLFLKCCKFSSEEIISSLQKKKYIMNFLQEIAKESDNSIDDFVLEFISKKLYD